MSDQSVGSDAVEGEVVQEEVPVRPWARYLAKMADFFLFSIPYMAAMFVVGLAIGYFAVDLDYQPLSNLVSSDGPASVLFWGVLAWSILLIVFPLYDAALVSAWGTTPGKALMGIRVTAANGEKLGFPAAAKRAYGSYLVGQAGGIPLISIVAMIAAYNRLTSEAQTGWDEGTGASYLTRPVNGVRWALGVVLFFGNVGVNLLDRALANGTLSF